MGRTGRFGDRGLGISILDKNTNNENRIKEIASFFDIEIENIGNDLKKIEGELKNINLLTDKIRARIVDDEL